jgi:hypothetical protein
MSGGNQLVGAFALQPESVPFSALTPAAVEEIKASTILALRDEVNAFTFPDSVDNADVSTPVLFASATDTPITSLTEVGIYVGPVADSQDSKRVIIFAAGTTDPIDDGTGEAVYGVLEEDAGVYTLNLKKNDGDPYIPVIPVNIDFLFVEVFSMENVPVDAFLNTAGSGGGGGGSGKGILSAVVVAEQQTALTATPNPLFGVALEDQDGVLLVGQDNKEENGLYTYVGADLVRNSSLTVSTQFKPGVAIGVSGGARAGSLWILTAEVDVVDTDPVVFASVTPEDDKLLKLELHPTNANRVVMYPSYKVLNDGTKLLSALNQTTVLFDGAQLDISDGNIYDFATGTSIIGSFTPPDTVGGQYFWMSVNLTPASIDAQNRIVGEVTVVAATTGSAIKDDAPRPGFIAGRPYGFIAIYDNGGGLDPLNKSSLELVRLSGADVTNPVREIPTGDIDGVNDTFTLTRNPLSKDNTFVFIDRMLVPDSEWTLDNDNEIVFEPSAIPQLGQLVHAFYFPDPFNALANVVGGQGGGDLSAFTTDIVPNTDGTKYVGSEDKGIKGVYLTDQTTGDKYRLEVDDGNLQAVLVE